MFEIHNFANKIMWGVNMKYFYQKLPGWYPKWATLGFLKTNKQKTYGILKSRRNKQQKTTSYKSL